MTNTNLQTVFAITFAVAMLGAVSIAPAFAAPVQNPTNGNHYELISAPDITWTDAKIAAETLVFDGVNGHLVTITSADENAFVAGLSSGAFRPWIGLSDAASEGDYQWVTSEPFVYSNWSSGEPTGGSEDYVEFFASNDKWNDNLNANNLITGYVVEYDASEKSLLIGILDELKEIWEAIMEIGNTVDRIETTVNNLESNTSSSTERVSVTVNLDDIKLKTGEVMVLLDTTNSGTLSTVHVAANLPCNDAGEPQIHVVAGVAGGLLSGVLTDAADNTGFDGPEKTCVFHDNVDADLLGHDITDVIIIHPDSHPDESGKDQKKHEKLKGVVVTITGTYN